MEGQLSLTGEAESGHRRVSVTALVELRRCPRRFEWSEVLGHARRQPGGATLGSAVHRAIQRGDREVPDQLAPYVDSYQRSPYASRRLVAAELPFRLRRPGVTVAGRIDAVYAEGDDGRGWELVDWKSGAAPAEPDAADEAQLEVYALAAIENYGRDPDRLVTTYFHLATGEARTTRWSRASATTAAARLIADLDRIGRSDYPATANHSCGGCDALPECAEGIAALSATLSPAVPSPCACPSAPPSDGPSPPGVAGPSPT